MSGDVQPRKRKDKKRKKDELGVEEPRGTAAALGEGDVFMHSHHEHATGGHWCAKIIFFSLLAILVTLIGLIILENRGLSDLEANSVESRYSGVLEGWLEDAPDDDHHDEHTLELTHHDDEDDHDEEIDNANDDDHQNEGDASDENEHSDEDFDHDEALEDDHELSDEDGHEENNDDDDDEENNEDDYGEDNQSDDDDSQEQEQNYEDDDEELEREDDEGTFQADEGAENDLQEIEENDNTDNSDEGDGNEVYDAEGDDDSNEIDRIESGEDDDNENQSDNEDEEEHEEEEEDDEEVEVEKLERENSEEEHEPISAELPALPEDDDDDEDHSDGKDSEADEDSGSDEEFLEMDDPDEPPVERITVPAGKPFVEVEEEISSEQPPDTLEEEEEYEKRQEELRREEAQASHMWLKLGVGAALLVATHAVLRRATHSRDAPESEEHASREETPVVDRRMTLIAEEPPVPARRFDTVSRPIVMEQVIEKMVPIVKSIPIRKQESEDDEEEKEISEDEEEKVISEDEDEEVIIEKPDERELYSEDEEIEEEEEEIVVAKKETPKLSAPVVTKKPEPEPESEEEVEDDPDVEIIGDEQLEEELEEEEDEEEISDVDDVELLTRLEAKYGRLADPERAGQKQKDGGNSVDDLWPGEPSDAYWRQQLDSAEQELRQGSWSAAEARAAAPGLRGSARARYVVARSLDLQAEAKRDNRILTRAIQAYLELLKMNERLSDKKLLEITGRTLDRIQFRGNYLSAEPVYRLLIRRFPNEPAYRNNLTISFLMANRVDLAEEALKETLKRWPKDRLALAHYGFVLKTKHNKYEEAAEAFREALEGDTGPANEARFYYHYGDSLLLLGRKEQAHEVHKRGAKLGHFLSPNQRSLYNVPRLESSPWWDVEKTPYVKLARALERSWREILKEGEAAKALYEQEKEGLKERGEWSQMDLFVRGREVPGRCERARATCAAVRAEPAAATCRRGQVKFSLMSGGTHVRAHVGPTNCRLRMHLGLSNTKHTYIRVDQEIRQWQEGKVLMFDDSFEHEVWHNGSGARLVLIVDVWHPDLTAAERARLPAI